MEDGNAPKLSVELSGDPVLRIGFNQIYTLTYSNSGNTDAKLVPLFIGGLPIGTDIDVRKSLFNPMLALGKDTLELSSIKIPHTINDTLSGTSYRIVFLNNIPAGSSGTIDIVFHVPLITTLHTTPQIITSLGRPYSTYGTTNSSPKISSIKNFSTISLDDIKSLDNTDLLSDATKCLANIDNTAIKTLVEKRLPDEDLTGLTSCLTPVFEKYVLDKFFDEGGEDGVLDANDKAFATMKQTYGCLRVGGTLVGALGALMGQPEFIYGALEFNEEMLASEQLLTKPIEISEALKVVGDCSGVLKFDAKAIKGVIIGNDVDPNMLYEPGSASINHYTNKQSLLNYTVNFENKPEANLNAQTVTVIDTLKKDYFNINTFGFTSVIIGDSTLNFSSPVKSFIHDFDFTSKYNVKARVVASFDTISGIAKWKFYTIDPATNQVTNKALDGFLPPDVKSPEGQGYVSYQVSPKAGLGTGDMIQNKAYITFDYNPVIPTNAWNNTFDLVAPVSKIEPLATTTADSTFVIHWGGSDNLSGIARYNIFYAVGNGSFQTWLNGTSATSAKFTGQKDSTYKFYSIAMDNAGNTEAVKTSAEATITVKVPKNQIIKFPQIANKTFGDADFDPGATVSSALPITYTTSNTGVATIVNAKLHITGAGTVNVTASQTGNQDYNVALPVNDTLIVNKAAQTITFPTILSKNNKDPDFNPGATSSSGLPVTYTTSNTAVLTVLNGQLHIVAPGTSTITATQGGNANYFAATSISQDIQVIFSLPANNFTISAISASCKGSSNGEIDMTAASTQNYTATVTSGASTTTYPFTGQLSVKNLPAGTYSVCITIADYPAFKQCFDVVVTEPKDLSVYSVVNPTLGTLSLSLAGASSYNITLNGNVYTTTQSNITLPLEPGSNTVKVTTASICQGIYEKMIQLPPGVLAYPNPFERILSLSIGNDRSSTANVEVYDIKGQKVYAGKSSINQGKCSLDLGSLAPGSYLLKLVLDHSETNIKIIKK